MPAQRAGSGGVLCNADGQQKGKVLSCIKRPSQGVFAMADSADSLWLATTSWDGAVHVWDLAPLHLFSTKKRADDRKAINLKYASPGYVHPVIEVSRRKTSMMGASTKSLGSTRAKEAQGRLPFEKVLFRIM